VSSNKEKCDLERIMVKRRYLALTFRDFLKSYRQVHASLAESVKISAKNNWHESVIGHLGHIKCNFTKLEMLRIPTH
jgi:hypothetical protein